jgi:16S rRNA C967 or C1407 C5-methylase (RsmB/RsmF family)
MPDGTSSEQLINAACNHYLPATPISQHPIVDNGVKINTPSEASVCAIVLGPAKGSVVEVVDSCGYPGSRVRLAL